MWDSILNIRIVLLGLRMRAQSENPRVSFHTVLHQDGPNQVTLLDPTTSPRPNGGVLPLFSARVHDLTLV